MEPQPWAGAGSAPYNNIIGIDPELMDPAGGDFRPAPGSPAINYGCQTFGSPRRGTDDRYAYRIGDDNLLVKGKLDKPIQELRNG